MLSKRVLYLLLLTISIKEVTLYESFQSLLSEEKQKLFIEKEKENFYKFSKMNLYFELYKFEDYNYNLNIHLVAYADVLKILKVLMWHSLTDVSTCRNLYEDFDYHSISVAEGYRILPCKKNDRLKKIVNVWKYKLAGNLCIPKFYGLLSEHRIIYKMRLVGDKRFHLNLTFPHFSFEAHSWCEGDFLHLYYPLWHWLFFYNLQSLEYVFCGKRHPWTIVYFSHILEVHVVARQTSNFTLLFQVMNSDFFREFHMCQSDHCDRDTRCDIKYRRLPQLRSVSLIFVSHIIWFHSMSLLDILHIVVEKYSYIQINIIKPDVLHSLFDGPSTESLKVPQTNRIIKMSSFQATVVIKDEIVKALQGTSTDTILFDPIKNKEKEIKISKNTKINFNTYCSSNLCTICKTLWLSQPQDYSYNVTLESMYNTGPEEHTNDYHYGGIAVYLIDENENVTKEVLQFNQNLSSETIMKSYTETTVITELSTKYVAIVYFYYSPFIVKAKLSVSLTTCVGYYITTKTCKKVPKLCVNSDDCTLQGIQQRYNYLVNVMLPKLKKCLFIHTVSDIRKATMERNYNLVRFSRYQVCPGQGDQFDSASIAVQVPENTVSEVLQKVHYSCYNSDSLGDIVLFDNFHKDPIEGDNRIDAFGIQVSDDRDIWFSQTELQRDNLNKSRGKVFHDNKSLQMNFRKFKKAQLSFVTSKRHLSFLFDKIHYDIFYSWVSTKINMLSCKSRIMRAKILPEFFTNIALSRHCTKMQKSNYDKKTIAQIKSLGYIVKYVHIQDIIKKIDEPKTAFIYAYSALYENMTPTPRSIYIKANLENISDSASLEFVYGCKSPRFHINISSTDLNLVFPTTTLWRCQHHLKDTFTINDRNEVIRFEEAFEPLHISLSESFVQHHEKFSTFMYPVKNKRTQFQTLKAHCIGKFKNCYGKFITWNQAEEYCNRSGMHLPSVNSHSDMEDIADQIDKYQYQASNIKLQNDKENVYILYQTIGIYLGLNLERNKYFWAKGNPVTVQYFKRNFTDRSRYLNAWDVYVQYLNQYYKELFNEKKDGEYIPWSNKEDHDVITNVAKVFQKASNINAFIAKESFLKNETCTILLVWHRNYFEWILVPCDENVLDQASLYCVNTNRSNEQNMGWKSENLLSSDGYTHFGNVFFCNDKSVLSINRVCDNKIDCLHEEDEAVCENNIHNISIRDILLCQFEIFFHLEDQYSERIYLNETNFSKQKYCEEEKIVFQTYSCDKCDTSCDDTKIKCEYNISNRHENRSLLYCQNGTHLDFCEDWVCNNTYKCPGYYCVPWRYVCDGFWDCPSGYDELSCKLQSKPGFYHCINSSIYIAATSICDNIHDCPDASDENFCNLGKLQCPVGCDCFFHSIFCPNRIREHIISDSLPHILVHFTHQDNTNGVIAVLNSLKNAKIIYLRNNSFLNFCLRPEKRTLNDVQVLHAPQNNIMNIQDNCLRSIPNVVSISFAKNKISSMSCDTLTDLSRLKILIFYSNKLQELKACTFLHLTTLKFLNVQQNDIKVVDENIFQSIKHLQNIIVVSSHNFICCINAILLCSAPTPKSCDRLLHNTPFVVITWMIGGCSLIINIMLMLSTSSKGLSNKKDEVKKAYNYLVRALSVSHIVYAIMLIFLAVLDQVHGNKFPLIKRTWHKSIFCRLLNFGSFCSFVEGMFSTLLLNISKYLVVKYPLHTRFKIPSFVLKLSFLGFSFSGIITMCFTTLVVLFDGEEESNKLCSPYGKGRYSTLSVVMTSFIIIVDAVSLVVLPLFSFLLVYELKKPSVVSRNSKMLSPFLVIKIIILTFFHYLSWFSLFIFIVVTLTMHEYPFRALFWVTVVLIPINSLVSPFVLGKNLKNYICTLVRKVKPAKG